MSEFYLLSDEEAQHWAEVRKRLLRPRINPMDYDGYQESPFNDPSWRIVPIVEQFKYGRGDAEGPKSGGWPCRDGLPDIEGYGDPLMWCLDKRGCEEIILSKEWEINDHPEVIQGPKLYSRCPPELSAVYETAEFLEKEESKQNSTSSMYCVMAFDTSEEWAIADGCELHHLLGGTPKFIEQYCEAAGGEDYVRAWFYHYMMWSRGFIDFDLDALYKLVGWPKPVMPEGGLWHNSGSDIDWTPMFGNRIKSCGPDMTDPDI